MRDYKICYTDPIIGPPGEVYETKPFGGSQVEEMKQKLEMLGCKVVDIKPFIKIKT